MSLLEKKKVENPTVAWARDRGILVRKMNGLGFNHWPDRLFCIPGGKPVFIEFKAPGKEPTPMQTKMIAQLKKDGYDVFSTDSSKAAIAYLSERLGANGVHEARRKVPSGARSRRPLPRSRNA